MKEALKQRIADLTALVGISGYEWDVSKYIAEVLRPCTDAVELRPNGALLVKKTGRLPGGRRMITAHMDEVGFEVKTISPGGFLFFDKVGKPTEGCIPGRRVLVRGRKGVIPGVIGVRAGHMLTPEQMSRPQTVAQSYVDIGAASSAQANEWGVFTGAQIVPDTPLSTLRDPDVICSRALDCRALCAVLVEVLQGLEADTLEGEVWAVFNVMEESTLASIPAAVQHIRPDYGIFLDTIPCGDVPDCSFAKELPVSLNGGPVLVLSQQLPSGRLRAVNHPALDQAVRRAAGEAGVRLQEFAFNSGGFATDAVTAGSAGEGIATVTLALPRRYSHSPVEVMHMDTAVEMEELVARLLRKDVDLGVW